MRKSRGIVRAATDDETTKSVVPKIASGPVNCLKKVPRRILDVHMNAKRVAQLDVLRTSAESSWHRPEGIGE